MQFLFWQDFQVGFFVVVVFCWWWFFGFVFVCFLILVFFFKPAVGTFPSLQLLCLN